MAYATVRAATSGELTNLRTSGQWSKLYLAVFKPSVVYSARLTTLPSSTDQVVELSFGSGVGTLSDIRPNMTMYVGTTSGAYDLGIVRIRKTPIAGTFYVGEHSDIDWTFPVVGGIYLTVVNEFDLWAKHIRTVDDDTFYMDHDLTYTDQNSVFDPVPIMGGHRVLKRTGVSVSVQLDLSNSWVIGSTVTGYNTVCSTSSGITGGTTATPTISFQDDGWHAVYSAVQATNGKLSVGMRYIYVYSDDNMPSVVFQLGDCSVDYDTGGWSFEVTVQDGLALADVPERALCILFAEDYYGATSVSMGQLAGCENILCIGKISEERISINPEQSEITLRLQGWQYWFSQIHAFPTGVIATDGTPANWAEMNSPTVEKVLFRLLHWGTNATQIMDVYLVNYNREAVELTTPSSNLWMQMQEIAFSTLMARPGIDRFGRLFVEVEPQITPDILRTYPTVMTLTKSDWHTSVNLERVVVSPVSMIDLSGVVATSADDGEAFFSLSPGHMFKHYGTPEVIDRLLLGTQELSNEQAGMILAWRNNQFPNIEFSLSSNNRMIDCFPRQRIVWNILSTDTPRGFSWSGNFIPRRVSFSWNPDTGFIETGLTLELETTEALSVNGDIPGDPDDYNQPPEPPLLPPIPLPPIVIPGDIPSTGLKAIVVNPTYGLLYSENFDDSSGSEVNWITINSGLTSLQYGAINRVYRLSSGGILVGTVGKNAFTVPFIAYAPSPGSTFTVLETATTIQDKMFSSGHTYQVCAIGFNPLTNQMAYVIGNSNTAQLYLGTGTSFAAVGSTFPVFHEVLGSISFGGDKWRMTGIGGEFSPEGKLWRFSSAGALETSVGTGQPYPNQHRTISTTEEFYFIQWLFTSNQIRKWNNSGAVATVGDADADPGNEYNIACDPTGQYVLLQWGAGDRGKSSDGLATITSLASLPFEGAYSFDYITGAGSSSYWAACAGRAYLSKNHGSTFSDQTGDLLTLAPTGGFRCIKAWY